MTDTDARARVAAEAMTWLDTPWHHMAGLKGVGVDCAHFVAAVYEAAGVIADPHIAPYGPQWFLNSGQELFLPYVERAGAREIAPETAGRGDLVLYRVGRAWAHGAIVLDWPGRIIHAHQRWGCVALSGAADDFLLDRPVRAFTFWGHA